MKALKHLNKYFYKYRYRLIVGIFITIIAKVFALFTPRLIGSSINVVSDRINGKITQEVFESQLFINILYLIGAAILAGIFTFLMRQTIINVSRFIEFDLKNEIYKHYQILSLSFYKANRTGDLMNRISEDVGKVRMYVGPAIMYTMNMITLFVVALIYMYSRSPELTLYTVLPLPILSIAIYKISQVINKRSRIVQESLSKLSSFTQEHFSGISVIKSYSIESPTNHSFEILSSENREKQIDLTKIQALFFPLMILLIGISTLIVAYVGGTLYINGKIKDIGTIAEFLIYVNMLTFPVAMIGWVTNLVQQAEASQKRINEFLKQEPEIKNNIEIPSVIEGSINFNNVSFTYPDTNINALKNVSFNIEAGKTLAILGKTGSGKSTILDLIGRLYDINKGEITIGSTLIGALNLNSLRESIGYVPQDAFLFSDSIKNNIKFGKENATDDDVIIAAKNAKVHSNINDFKDGYNTVLGERGITLSGGQKQRISIARAIIKSPDILLFDDCLSAVDTETEEQILTNLNRVSKDKTTIIVSHRVSSAKNADHIIVLDEGRIIQTGTHASLTETEGYYKDLCIKQRSEKEI
ncbi:ABC transporter ATP-binding protein [Winogradskyella immobilis]|uniref:ABC transporter ATP-binding protein n=1 Tax=Winogradskyella immobilis TaxID=2816852 RepID=A0ABS8EPY2_9FLAO|nr:ABC transporter ATP-binding protein [Winogradskyella immobilis]MCC1485061.1 ABC transporter ATP-binding protein [Winogradskyella immobilis]MCG0017153.1 ABC transporter ATP-binding protein/permease [Winogradskyella immobilis]